MVELTTGQLIAALVFLVGTIGSLLGVIRHLYEVRIAECNSTIAVLRAREAKRDEADDHYLQTLEQAVELMRVQASVTSAAVKATPRRRTVGSD